MVTPVAPQSANLAEWLNWLETLSPREIVLGLDRVQAVLSRLGLQRPKRVVTVAGTNGKGSTAAMLAALYGAAGCKVAIYTSPHVSRFNERMCVADQMLSDSAIVNAFLKVESVRQDVPLTYFEFGTLAALVAFAEARAEVYVLEVGLGGRLDAVNAIDPDGAVICNVSLDHCDWLGADVESIAREKAGVMRAGIPVVYGASPAPQAIVDIAQSTGANLLLADRDFHVGGNEPGRPGWTFAFRDLAPITLQVPALAGKFQVRNAAGALALYQSLEGTDTLTPPAIDAAFSAVRLAGRMQRLDTTHRWLLDVGHNPAAAKALAEELARSHAGNITAILGVLADKDLTGLVQPLLPHVDSWIAVTPRAPRALPAMELASRVASLAEKPCWIAESIEAALTLAVDLSAQTDLIVVTGSFYTVGPALDTLAPVARSTLGYTRDADTKGAS
ncbi:MAG: bifunctional folylpolyglutamate synthase/dihydrofolate synthase [Woeseia sp.]|nr:bifunctional folylpolyglutamate synthase/dihydrofolate synthase [Woeseia sp.]